MLKSLILCLAALVGATAYSAEHTKDTDDTVKASIASHSAVLVDVRETDEWKAGHLKDAVHVPLSDIKAGKTAALPKGKTLYLHCQAGGRVLVAADMLKDAKFTDVRPLATGYPDLLKQGFPAAP